MEMATNLKDAIGNFEFSVIPRALFSSDGYLHIPNDKSTFITEIEKYESSSVSRAFKSPINSLNEKLCVIDGMAIVQSRKKLQP